MSPECKDGALSKTTSCPRCGKKAISTTNNLFYQCCSRYGGCGHGFFMKGLEALVTLRKDLPKGLVENAKPI